MLIILTRLSPSAIRYSPRPCISFLWGAKETGCICEKILGSSSISIFLYRTTTGFPQTDPPCFSWSYSTSPPRLFTSMPASTVWRNVTFVMLVTGTGLMPMQRGGQQLGPIGIKVPTIEEPILYYQFQGCATQRYSQTAVIAFTLGGGWTWRLVAWSCWPKKGYFQGEPWMMVSMQHIPSSCLGALATREHPALLGGATKNWTCQRSLNIFRSYMSLCPFYPKYFYP